MKSLWLALTLVAAVSLPAQAAVYKGVTPGVDSLDKCYQKFGNSTGSGPSAMGDVIFSFSDRDSRSGITQVSVSAGKVNYLRVEPKDIPDIQDLLSRAPYKTQALEVASVTVKGEPTTYYLYKGLGILVAAVPYGGITGGQIKFLVHYGPNRLEFVKKNFGGQFKATTLKAELKRLNDALNELD